MIGELEDLRRRTGGQGPRWRTAVAAIQMFLATMGGAVADLTVDPVVEASIDWTDPASADW